MDEIKETPQDVPEKAPSEEVSETTPQAETKTFSKDEVEKMINDRLSAVGRDAKSLSEKEQSLANHEKELQQRQEEIERRNQEARFESRKKEIEALMDDPDGVAKARYRHQMEDENEKLRQENEQHKGAVSRMFVQATGLMEKFNLPPNAFSDLMNAANPKHMEDLAEKISLKTKVEVSVAPKKEPLPKPDSGISDAGADSDKAFLERWNSGDLPPTKENIARVNKIISK